MINRYPRFLYLSTALALLAASGAADAQNADNGRHLSERWCAECHAIGPAPDKSKAQSFATIAAKPTVTADMIASFLRLPHATMPNVPLTRSDARDIAAFIVGMKK